MPRLNINILLCEKCDADMSNIYNIFDTIRIDEEKKASFSIVTQISGFGKKYNKWGLFFFIEKAKEEKIQGSYSYLGRVIIEKGQEVKRSSCGHVQLSSQDEVFQELFPFDLKQVYFPGAGNYEIQVYLYEDEEIPDEEQMKIKEERKRVRNPGKLVALYDFEVI